MEQLALDTLAVHWHDALDEVEEALEALMRNRSALGFAGLELRRRTEELRLERQETELDLRQLARATHLAPPA